MRQYLKEDNVNLILDDINKISKEFYGSKRLLSIETIKTSPVFQKRFEGLDELKSQYQLEKLLYFGEAPNFEELDKRICKFIKSL